MHYPQRRPTFAHDDGLQAGLFQREKMKSRQLVLKMKKKLLKTPWKFIIELKIMEDLKILFFRKKECQIVII